MAHAYETFAQDGRLTFGTMSPGQPDDPKITPIPGPVGVDEIGRGRGADFKPLELDGQKLQNHVRSRRVLDPNVATTVGTILQTVVKTGTATRAAVPGVTIAGKTGTTEGYGDAWFVGWTPEYTIAIWVGYPDKFKPMETEFQGKPVAGGTYPSGIFKTFVESLVGLKLVKKDKVLVPTTPLPPVPEAPSGGAVTQTPSGGTGTIQGGGQPSPAATPPPANQQPTPAPTQPAPTPSNGGGSGGAQPAPTAAPGNGTSG
jgi:penicillin-binding protein 1A